MVHAGRDWKSAVYRKVQEEVKADRGMTIERMVKLGPVSRSAGHPACTCTGSSVQRSKESRQLGSGPGDQVISATMSVPDSARSMLPMA
jgi:hypothetical protein